MKQLINKVQLIGNLGAAPELMTFDNGNKMAKFSIATNESYKDKNGELIENTQWHNVVAWGAIAETASKYLNKGSKVAINGKLANRNWEDKDGNKRYTTEVVMNEMLILDQKKD